VAEQKSLIVVDDNLIAEEESPAAVEVVELLSLTTLEEGPAAETEGLAHMELIQPEEVFTEVHKDEAAGLEEVLPTEDDELLMVDEELLATIEELSATECPRLETKDSKPENKRPRAEEEDPGLVEEEDLRVKKEDLGLEADQLRQKKKT
jgi:hypothetical protein